MTGVTPVRPNGGWFDLVEVFTAPNGRLVVPPGSFLPSQRDAQYLMDNASDTSRHGTDEVELLMANARLRDELEPYRDESIDSSINRMPLRAENEYLESMLAWERAPALPISSWFNPPLQIPAPEDLDDKQLESKLKETIDRLYSNRVVLRFTDHLSDRELYKIIYRDILPCCEKKVDIPTKILEWHCVDDNDTWLRYYANAIERRRYQEERDVDLPASEKPRYRRDLPG